MEISQAVAAVGHAADACAQVDLDTVDVSELRKQVAEFRTAISRPEAQFARIAHAAERAGAHFGTGARDTAEWIGQQTGTSTVKNRAASDLGEAMAKSEPLADAVVSGRISNDKANAAISAAGGLTLDAELVDQITNLRLNSVRPAAENWRAHNNASREADRAARQRSQRYLRLTSAKDGMTRIDGLLDPESAAIVRTTFDAIMNQSAFDDSGRRRDQRCADALTQLAKAASKGNILGGRSNAKMLVTVPFQTVVERGTARGVTHAGPTIDADTVRHMACDAGIHRVITGPGSSILDFGRENRLVSNNLFLALVTRDQHCRWPHCTIRATWCDAHHITQWGHHGRTNELTCALLCHHHHSLTHQPGWSITGNGHQFTIHPPDGTTQTSQPPTTPPARPTPRKTMQQTGPEPPRDARPRADTNGREMPVDNAPASGQMAFG
ncbi:MAG: DUF222 domain-containing protein [Ilumatobacter sp.]|uniref:HNH endonuclease signature motif containing protein n=1 Tax=Ilumatobacter sp. TaxID=1967498 RepID=UPI003C7309A7